MIKTGYISATTTAPSRESAEQIAETLIQKRLAACVQIVDSITSYYWWEDSMQKDSELLIIIKTTRTAVPVINRLLAQIHPYELPELIALPIEAGNPEYLEWLHRSVQA
ncbi:Divalent-cation tolerance protein CutA [subsurface metagenome]